MKNRIISLFIAITLMFVMLTMSAVVQVAFSGSGWSYSGGTLTITTNKGTGAWKGEMGASFNESNVRTVIIRNGVTSIEAMAFEGCARLKSVTIPEGVTSIAILIKKAVA